MVFLPEVFFQAIGVQDDVSKLAIQFCRIMILSVWPIFAGEVLHRFLANQNIVIYPNARIRPYDIGIVFDQLLLHRFFRFHCLCRISCCWKYYNVYPLFCMLFLKEQKFSL